MTGPIASGAVRYYWSADDMPPEWRAREAQEARTLAAARRRFDELLQRLAAAGWPPVALTLVDAHAPRLFLGRPVCVECEECDDCGSRGDWPCWTITTAEKG